MFIGIADPELISVSEVVKHASRAKKMVNGSRHIFQGRPTGGDGVHKRLGIVEILIQREEECCVLASQGAGDRAFIKLALFGSLLFGEGVTSVKNRIADEKVYRAMEVRSATLRDHF